VVAAGAAIGQRTTITDIVRDDGVLILYFLALFPMMVFVVTLSLLVLHGRQSCCMG